MKGKILAMCSLLACTAYAADNVSNEDDTGTPALEVAFTANTSSGTFAPHLISSLRQGKVTQGASAFIDASLVKECSTDGAFGWGYGLEVMTGLATSADYERWDNDTRQWTVNPQHPANLILQQCYADVRCHAFILSAGLKERTSAMFDERLSSGDFVYSGNSRPIPQVMIGFSDFCDIPLTNRILQIDGVMSYGAMTDGAWLRNHFNYYNYHLVSGQLYTYKRIHFRTNPRWRLSAEFGAQVAAFFGGKAIYYDKGRIYRTLKYKKDIGSFLNMVFPVFTQAETFVQGQNLGSWDFKCRYTLDSDNEISAYFQWPFEDGSGVAKRNGWDGIWGIEYRHRGGGAIKGAVLEYVDFRNQSGPIHYAPDDFSDPTLTTNLTGRDNYYNNSFYNSYANYGMSIGTPFMVSPIYNLNGYIGFAVNRVNGIHAGVEGDITRDICYRALFSYRRGMGTYDYPLPRVQTCTSAMAEARYRINRNFSVCCCLAFDAGALRGNNFGALFSVTYRTK